jgi:hypothetical protein
VVNAAWVHRCLEQGRRVLVRSMLPVLLCILFRTEQQENTTSQTLLRSMSQLVKACILHGVYTHTAHTSSCVTIVAVVACSLVASWLPYHGSADTGQQASTRCPSVCPCRSVASAQAGLRSLRCCCQDCHQQQEVRNRAERCTHINKCKHPDLSIHSTPCHSIAHLDACSFLPLGPSKQTLFVALRVEFSLVMHTQCPSGVGYVMQLSAPTAAHC